MALRSLRRRLAVLVLVPVASLLAAVGFVGALYSTDKMLDQWREASQLKLERAGHYLSMRIMKPVDQLRVLLATPSFTDEDDWKFQVLSQLGTVGGVDRVALVPWYQIWGANPADFPEAEITTGTRSSRVEISNIRSATTVPGVTRPGVAISLDLWRGAGARFDRVEIVMDVDYLLEDLHTLGWWEGDLACLVDFTGNYIAHSGPMAAVMAGRSRLGDTGDSLETAVLEALRTRPSGTEMGEGYPPRRVAGFNRVGTTPLTLILYAPGTEILRPIVTFATYYSLAGLLCIATIILLIRLVEGNTVKTIQKLSTAVSRVARGEYGDPLPEKGRDEIAQLVQSFNAMTDGLKERDRIYDTFGRYVDPDVARRLLRRPEATRLGGVKRTVAILMSDIRDFTAVADSLTPEQTIRVLNRYFSQMIDVIHEHHGIIVDFYGDGILVFFDPMDGSLAEATDEAISCALDMQRVHGRLNVDNRKLDLPELNTGIAVHVGTVVVGNVGSQTRAKYGIVGSMVNVTARIQTHARSGEILVTDDAFRSSGSRLAVQRSFPCRLEGIQEVMTLHAIEEIAPHQAQGPDPGSG